MPATPVGIIVDPNGQTSAITITAASGNAVTAYTSNGGSSTHTFPVSISVPTEFWLVQPAQYTLAATGSAGANGTGGNLTVDLRGGGVQSVQLGVVDDGDPGEQRLETFDRAAYVTAVLPSAYGAVGNGTTDDTAALQATINAANAAAVAAGIWAKAKVVLGAHAYACSGLTNPGQVVIDGHGATLKANASGPMLTFTGIFGALDGAFLNGNGLAQGANGVVFSATAKWNRLDANFDSFAGRAVYTAAGSIGNDIRTQLVTNCLKDTASLSTYTGAVELNGTDHYFWNSEVSVSRSSLSSASMYAAAIVLLGANHMVSGVVGETSDVGWVINADDIKIVNSRADLNRAHGVILLGGNGSLEIEALNNSQEADGTYSGVYATGGQFDGRVFARSTVANRHKYGVEDQQNSGSSYNRWNRRSLGHASAAFFGPNAAPGHFMQYAHAPQHPGDGVTTFGVSPGFETKFVVFQNTGATSLTDFTSAHTGQELVVMGDGLTTLVHDVTKLYLTGQQNLLLAAKQCVRLVRDNGVWYQTDGYYPPATIHRGGTANSAFTWTAQVLAAVRFQVTHPTPMRYFLWEVVVQAGNIDVGVVKLSGTNHLSYTRVAALGSTACPAVGAQRTDLGAFMLSPGDYAMCIWGDSSTFQTRGQGSRSDLQTARQSLLKTAVASGGIPASGTFGQFWSTDLAVAVEAAV